MKTFISKSPKETERLGMKLASQLGKSDVIALSGELGSGKTTLTKGIAKGLNVEHAKYVNSPSFVIIKEYAGKLPLYHMDLYRLEDVVALDTVGYEEYIWSDGVCVIEWAKKILNLLPDEYMMVEIEFKGERERQIRFLPRGVRYKKMAEKLK